MKLAVIGGSSLVKFDPQDAFGPIGFKVISSEEIDVETTYGVVRLRKFELSGEGGVAHTIYFMQRHSHGGSGGIESGITPPHKINYHANVRALADLQVDMVVATASVGTILPVFPPGRVGVANQYIDFTGAATTFFHDDAKFTSMTEPFNPTLNQALLKTLRTEQKLEPEAHLEFTFWLSTGPHYESKGEIEAIKRMGGECVGMTAPREAKLCAELDLPYAVLVIASNWAAGCTPGDPTKPLNHEEVSETSKGTTGIIIACLVDLLKTAPSEPTAKKAWYA